MMKEDHATFGSVLGSTIWGFPKIRGAILGGPYNKDYSILGVYIGVPLFGETTILTETSIYTP